MDILTSCYDRLHSAFETRTITADLLSEMVRTIEKDADEWPFSVGATWLFNATFRSTGWRMNETGTHVYGNYEFPRLAIFADCGIDPLKFFRDHMDVREFAKAAIRHGQFIRLLPESERSAIMREVYLRYGCSDDDLVRAGLVANIPREDLAHMLRTRLESVQVKEGVANELDDFLTYGFKQEWSEREQRQIIPDDSPWAVFDNDALKELFLLCACKSPTVTMKERKKIEIRLGHEVMMEICHEAAKHLTSLRCLELPHLTCLTADEKAAIVSRIELQSWEHYHHALVAGLIVEVALSKQGEQAVLAYFESVWDLLDKMNAPSTCYKTAVGIIGKAKGNPNASLILDLLFVRLRQAGYIIGQVEDEFHTGKRGRRLQHVVNHKGMKYVHDDFNHRWWPTKGDRVIVNTKGHRLTPTVVLSYFYPLDKEVRD